jgi:hypothetical protein
MTPSSCFYTAKSPLQQQQLARNKTHPRKLGKKTTSAEDAHRAVEVSREEAALKDHWDPSSRA